MNIKKIFVSMVIFSLFNCKSQNITNTMTMEKFNSNSYKSLQPDLKSTSFDNDRKYVADNKNIRIITGDKEIQVEENELNSLYRTIKIYSATTNIIMESGKFFDGFPIGVWTKYNVQGFKISEIDWDINYPFSLEDLIQEMMTKYKIDVLDSTRVFSVRRYLAKQDPSSPIYEVIYKSDGSEEQLECFLFDGNTGELLFRTYQSAGDKKGSLYDQYVNSLNIKN